MVRTWPYACIMTASDSDIYSVHGIHNWRGSSDHITGQEQDGLGPCCQRMNQLQSPGEGWLICLQSMLAIVS